MAKAMRTRKERAKEYGIPFDITLDDLLPLPEVCPVLGIKLEHGRNSGIDSSPSVDRINPAVGYVKGNVVVVSARANRIKSDATLEELEKVCAFYRTLSERKTTDAI